MQIQMGFQMGEGRRCIGSPSLFRGPEVPDYLGFSSPRRASTNDRIWNSCPAEMVQAC